MEFFLCVFIFTIVVGLWQSAKSAFNRSVINDSAERNKEAWEKFQAVLMAVQYENTLLKKEVRKLSKRVNGLVKCSPWHWLYEIEDDGHEKEDEDLKG
jgi:predicted ATP-grasp superfamily ATP-dependent carboligase